MQAEYQELKTLLAIQKIDLAIMQAKKKRAELPQRIEVMRVRKKRGEIQAKLDQVLELQNKAQVEMTAVEDEDRSLVEKQQRAQELIDNAGSDYRAVESHSKEMAGTAKRRETLAEKLDELSAHMAKIAGLRGQLEAAIVATEDAEAKLRTAFEDEDRALIETVRQATEKREELMKGVSSELAKLYEKTASKTGDVAIGVLDEGACSVCRTKVEEGRLIELRASALLGRCPACKRLLVVE